MKFETAALVALAVLPHHVEGVRCGKWFSNDCLGASDPRYDPDYPNEFLLQDPRWEWNNGFFRVVATAFDEIDQLQGPTIYDPAEQPFPDGFPYPRDPFIAFYNNTYVGSRLESNRYLLYPPAPPGFCNLPVAPGQLNVFGRGECGVNGFARPAGFFSTTTFEKDGSGQSFRGFGDDGRGQNSTDRFVDDFTINSFANSDVVSSSSTAVFLDASKTTRDAAETFFILDEGVFRRWRFTRYNIVNITEQEFVEGILNTYDEFNILESDRLPVPFQTAALVPEAYPNETEWCTFDPNCSESPYQEPDGTTKAGVIAGFCILGFVIVLALVYVYFTWRLKKQRQRYKEKFVHRLAQSINLEGSPELLEGDDLLREFQKISGDGRYIKKEELLNFMHSGKAGKMSNSDFNAMWAALDPDDNGVVDFSEFCAFIGYCGDHMADPKAVDFMTPEEKMNFAARSLSKSIVRLSAKKEVRVEQPRVRLVETGTGIGMLVKDGEEIKTA